jgi:two-component sensor histidine kinase
MRWVAAALLFAAALMARIILGPVFGASPALTFFPALLVGTVLLGWEQGSAILLAGTASSILFFLPPQLYLQPVGWLIVGGLTIAIIGSIQHLGQELAAANERQRVLFQELQHRVANTLQTNLGTIEIARKRISKSPGEADALLAEAAARMAASIDVHRRLHDPALFAKGLQDVFRDAVSAVIDARSVQIRLEVNQLDLSFDQMAILTMLVIEAANNSQKHVFQHQSGKQFSVLLKAADRGQAILIVADDGPGIPTVEASEDALGFRIIRNLASQLHGTSRITSIGGTEITVQFPLQP